MVTFRVEAINVGGRHEFMAITADMPDVPACLVLAVWHPDEWVPSAFTLYTALTIDLSRQEPPRPSDRPPYSTHAVCSEGSLLSAMQIYHSYADPRRSGRIPQGNGGRNYA